jgi:hypothetical protein
MKTMKGMEARERHIIDLARIVATLPGDPQPGAEPVVIERNLGKANEVVTCDEHGRFDEGDAQWNAYTWPEDDAGLLGGERVCRSARTGERARRGVAGPLPLPRRDVQDAARHADPRTPRRYRPRRHSLDRHARYRVAAYVG